MSKMQVFIRNVGAGINKHSPSILIGLGVSGFIATLAMAIRNTGIAMDAIDQHLFSQFLEEDPKHKDYSFDEFMMESHAHGYAFQDRISLMQRKDVAKVVAPVYAPVLIGAGLSVAAILFANRQHLRRTAVLVSMYDLAETSLRSYQHRVVENIGANKAAKFQNESYQEFLDADPVTEHNIHNVGGGTELCWEVFTGRYFWSNAETIRATLNEFNRELLTDNTKTLDELYYEFGLPGTEMGGLVGWDSEDGLVELMLSANVSKVDERPCLVVDFVNRPRYLAG